MYIQSMYMYTAHEVKTDGKLQYKCREVEN